MSLILSENPLALWRSVIQEASLSYPRPLPHELEAYLVFLVMRFTDKPEITNSVLATQYLCGMQMPANKRENALQTVGDTCLLLAGFFPLCAVRKQVKISYFVHLGEMAYATISCANNDIYARLSRQFVALMDILQAVRQAKNDSNLLPLQAYDLWQETGSQYAYQVLQEYSLGLPISNTLTNFNKHMNK